MGQFQHVHLSFYGSSVFSSMIHCKSDDQAEGMLWRLRITLVAVSAASYINKTVVHQYKSPFQAVGAPKDHPPTL